MRKGREGGERTVLEGWLEQTRKQEGRMAGRGELVQKGGVGEEEERPGAFVFPKSSLFCVEEGMTTEHVPVNGYFP